LNIALYELFCDELRIIKLYKNKKSRILLTTTKLIALLKDMPFLHADKNYFCDLFMYCGVFIKIQIFM